ncbi:MAG: hypothetical protein HYY87_02795 [Candidatus Levybacteria bacterium]|nr:hypothetical protein [Candidatus Levybacteria bacterium]
MKMNSNNSNGGFVNGFLWGAIIGASVVFLLGTKKGKRLLKTVTEEGLEGVSGLKELVEEYSGDEEEEPEKGLNGEKEEEKSFTQGFGRRARRFFKGIPKRR